MYKKILKKLVVFLLVSSMMGQMLSVAEHKPASVSAAELSQASMRIADKSKRMSESDRICTINGTDRAEDAGVELSYNGKKIPTGKTPVILYQGKYFIAFEALFHKKGPKVDYEFNELAEHVKLVYQNRVVTFFLGDDYLYADGEKMNLDQEIVKGFYTGSAKFYYFVPLTSLCTALGFDYTWDLQNKKCVITGKKVRFPGKKIYTQYAYSRKAFARKEYQAVRRIPYKEYLTLVTPSKDTTADFKFLRVDRYREVDQKKFTRYYQYLIQDYCRQVGISVNKSSLYGKASEFLKAAKKYQLDPVYLVNQTFLESAYGTSELASGKKIKRVANRNYARTKKGKFKTHKLKKAVKVYNLYGIKAYDADPVTGGTSYAYYHNWTTPTKAIYGAAAYLKSNYIQGSYHQNTIFKMRFTFRSSIWHQYATGPYYAESIGKRMYLMSSCYAKDAEFLYDYPKYR